jgi:hypothetical protein
MSIVYGSCCISGADPGLQVRGGGALKKNAPSGGRRENFWGISCEKSRFYARKPEYQEKTTDHGGNRSTRRKPTTVEETGVPGENN